MTRRSFHVITTGLVVFGIGYLIAVAARSLPGQESEEPAVEIGFTAPAGIQEAIVWVTLGATAIGAIFLVLMVKRGNPGKVTPLRSLYTFAIWVILLLIIFRYSRPAIEQAGEFFSELDEAPAPGDPGGSPTITAASWIVSAVIAAAIAAALVRLAVIARSTEWRFDRLEEEDSGTREPEALASPITRMEGVEPRARVINAYAEFESSAREAGVGRWESETARRHAGRAEKEMSLDHRDVSDLSSSYESARFAAEEIDESAAQRAETSWQRLKGKLTR